MGDDGFAAGRGPAATGVARDKTLVWITNHLVSRVVFSRVRLWWYRRIMHFTIGPGSSVLVDVRFAARFNLSIGAHSVINNGCRIDNRGGIEIGDNVSISYGVSIYTKGHAIDSRDFHTQAAPVRIAGRCWVCAQAIVLPGVTLGEGAVVLTGSVVPADVEPYTVVGGNPAKLVRTRSRELDYVIDFDPWVPFFG